MAFARSGQRFRLMEAFTYAGGVQVNAHQSIEVSVTINGARRDMGFVVWSPDLESGLETSLGKCTTKGTLVFQIINSTAGNVTPSSHTYFVLGL